MHKTLLLIITILLLLLSGCQDFGNGPRPTEPPKTELSVDDTTTLEGQTLTFHVILGQAHPSDVTASWRLSNGTAQAGSDYVADSGTITIPATMLSDSVMITTISNATIEQGEQFTIHLYDPVNAGIDDSVAVGTIWDDDGVRYAADIMPIVTQTCALSGCHSDGYAGFGLALGDGSWKEIRYQKGDNGRFIIPGNADSSLFYLLIRPEAYLGIDRMPQGGPYLASNIRQLIIDWINQGAQDN